METLPFRNRRKVARIKINCPLAITWLEKKYYGDLRNLSLYGLSLHCPEMLPFEEPYEFHFSLPQGPEIRAQGELLWRIQKAAGYEYGARISVKGMLTKLKLRLFIRKKMETEF